jgi:ubiquinone/menaquinone biosynthesis C-methylase UbiE
MTEYLENYIYYMNEFDIKAAGWDKNPMHLERSEAIAGEIKRIIPLNTEMRALEYGAGTGITSFLLKDYVKEITLMDNSSGMVNIMNKKIEENKAFNLKALNFDLEHNDYDAEKFDLIFTQMVLHHVSDIENIIGKFNHLLSPGGYLAIADLYPEDGTFHDTTFNGHLGFDLSYISSVLNNNGFADIAHKECYIINRKISENVTKQFPVFLLTARNIRAIN